MAEIAAGAKSGKVVIKNIGLLLSGDIDKPILDADTLVVNDGLIVAVGKEKDCDLEGAQTVIDAKKTCVAPGLIDTAMLDENVPVEELMKMIPAQRMGTPEEVAAAVNFLMSAEASYITRQVLAVNGGLC